MHSEISPKFPYYYSFPQPSFVYPWGPQVWTHNTSPACVGFQNGQNSQNNLQIQVNLRIQQNSLSYSDPRYTLTPRFNPNSGFYASTQYGFVHPYYQQNQIWPNRPQTFPNNLPPLYQIPPFSNYLPESTPNTTEQPDHLKNTAIETILPCYTPTQHSVEVADATQLAEKKKLIKDVLKHFEWITDTVIKIFRDPKELISYDFDLQPAEKVLLFEIMCRKFHATDLECKGLIDSSPEELLSWVLKRCVFKSRKRIEERKKFIFKHTLKHMKETFFKKLSGLENYTNKKIEQIFYNHYFRDSRLESKPAAEWLDPFNSKDVLRKHKTLSRAYLSAVFECQLFRDDFVLYFEGPEFAKDYQSSIRQKILILMKRSEVHFEHSESLEQFTKISSDYFQKNNQCKFPWSVCEINHSVGSFRDFLKRVQKN